MSLNRVWDVWLECKGYLAVFHGSCWRHKRGTTSECLCVPQTALSDGSLLRHGGMGATGHGACAANQKSFLPSFLPSFLCLLFLPSLLPPFIFFLLSLSSGLLSYSLPRQRLGLAGLAM